MGDVSSTLGSLAATGLQLAGRATGNRSIATAANVAGSAINTVSRNKAAMGIIKSVALKPVLNFVVDTMGLTKQQRIQAYSNPITQLVIGPTVYDTSVDEDDYVPPTSLPSQFVETEPEVNQQKKRWAEFAAYMSKPFSYNSLFQQQLRELDSLGAINLERTTREQIPGLQINYCCAMFINPYEGEQHSLGSEPLSDALLMAKLFIERKYRVFYFCDASPVEYYRWMSWLIDNVDLQL
ncbi:MAG: hypothetical protein EZS28_039794, partial [Streblomastix strix]